MIDPDGLQISHHNLPSNIKLENVQDYDIECYCLEDEKDFNKFINDTERDIRRSYEYREFIKYIRDNMQMNKCAFLEGVTNEETFDIKIEIHHYPFSLHDIVEIVLKKRLYYNESTSKFMVAKEVMSLHYKLVVGLIPLSQTVHELAHSGKLFVPSDKVVGRYNMFVDLYKPFCTVEQLEVLDRIEKYSRENRSDILDTTILNQNTITYEIKDPRFMLPDTSKVNTLMIEQMQSIKANNYILPSINDRPMIEEKPKRKLISFDPGLVNTTGKYSWQ